MLQLLADVILVVHFGFVLFVLLGFFAILIGRFIHWDWIYHRLFRLLHLAAIGIVVLQAWLGRLCPLTLWENALRQRAGQSVYEASFVQHWVQRLLYYDAEPWVFVVLYTVFAALVAGAWWRDRDRLHK